MSTYSSNLRLELIGNGEQAGTWGTTTNVNLGTLLEGAISGYATVSVTSANQALTANNGASDEARLAMLRLTTTTTAAFNVYVPPVSKQYVIRNDTAYVATIYNSTVIGNTTAAGLGVAIPAGKVYTAYTDGTNFRAVGAANATLADTATVATGMAASGLTGQVAIANGGTGASDAATARTNLGAAPLNSPTFTGTPAAPTAAPGTSTTQLATTAFAQAAAVAALQAVYPIGSVYINAAVTTNPATLLGFGTWVEIGAGRVLVGQNTVDASFDTLGETGGSKDAIAVAHTHTFSGTTDSAGSHTHAVTDPGHYHTKQTWNGAFVFGDIGQLWEYVGDYNSVNQTQTATTGISIGSAGAHTHTATGTTDSTGTSGTNANLQPYVVVKMWQRTA